MKTNLILTLLFFCTSLAYAKVIKVPQDHPKIQLAVNAAVNGDTVLVAEGTYFENLVVTKKITIGSVYLMDKDTSHISKTIIDGGTPSKPDSASVILILPGTDSTTVVKGFTIQNGKGTLASIVYAPHGTLVYRSGGGIAIIPDGGATISNNVVKNNTCQNLTGYAAAAGISVSADDSVSIGPSPWVIENNTIINNSSISQNGSDGGGLSANGRGRIVNNIIMHNSASGSAYGAGGGVLIYAGFPGTQDIDFSKNFIAYNSAGYGGGIYMNANSGLGSPTVKLKNNIIVGNSSDLVGAAIGVDGGLYSFINNTVSGNSGPQAISLEAATGPLTFRLMNNIIWNPNSTAEFNTTTNISSGYNCVRGGLTGTGNISADPLFIASDSLYKLSSNSPCISAGVMSASVGGSTLSAPSFDFLGMNRPRPLNTKPDLGAIESDVSTGVTELISDKLPAFFSLSQNYPNPFNPSTMMRFQLPAKSFVSLRVFDLLGREVATLVNNEERTAGSYHVQWNASNMPSGVYLYRLNVGPHSETRKLLLMK